MKPRGGPGSPSTRRILPPAASSSGVEESAIPTVGGRVLMSSTARRSELALAEIARRPLAARDAPRVLVGGLGMGFTLRAALARRRRKVEMTD